MILFEFMIHVDMVCEGDVMVTAFENINLDNPKLISFEVNDFPVRPESGEWFWVKVRRSEDDANAYEFSQVPEDTEFGPCMPIEVWVERNLPEEF